MQESLGLRLKAIARRAGIAGAPPAVVMAGIALLLLAVAVGFWRWWPRGDASVSGVVEAPAARPAASTAKGTEGSGAGSRGSSESSTSKLIVVHVVGAVKQPGVYELAPESRVLAAIQCAGGLTQEAAPEALNLAAKVTDGEQVAVPTRKEVESGDAGPGAGSAPAGTGGSAAGAPTGKVNVNTADATQLDALPGVGPSTAAKIVADRQSNGPFASPDELGRVPGIGPKKLEQLKVLISVR